jgi:hypothetical protein
MKIILQLLLILVIVATFSICAIKPKLHKNVIVYDSDYTLVSEQEVKTETKNIPVMEMPSQPVQKTTVAETKIEPTVKTSNTKTSNVKQQTQTKPKQTATVKQTVTKPQTKTVTKPVTTNVQKPVVKEVVKIEQPKVEQKTVNTTPQSLTSRGGEVTHSKVLTQQEETIAWNKWRSNLTNQIMQDTKLPDIPNGVLFQFSFTVYKYGKVTNVQTGANPANYTPYAIQYIAPVIRSYQGRSILNFPSGTARTSTQVTCKWRISNTQKYSTPQDYNDVEKVIR